MKAMKLIFWLATVFPIVFVISILGSPFYAMCCWGAGKDVMGKILDATGEKLKDSLIAFAI
jgi:hypothetical protein